MAIEHYDKCSLLLPMDGANNGTVFTDWSVDNNSVSRAGATPPVTSTSEHKYYGSSGSFPSSSGSQVASRLQISKLLFGSGKFTFASWIKPSNAELNYHLIDGRANSGFTSVTNQDTAFTLVLLGSESSKLAFVYGASALRVEAIVNFTTDWCHCAVTRDNSNIVRVFFNGVNVASGSVSNNFSNIYAVLGGTIITGTYPQRYLSDLIILTGEALWTDDFTPPTRLIGELSNTNAANPVEDESGDPVERTLIAVPCCYPTRGFGTQSDSNGEFLLRAPSTECNIIALHEGDPMKNDLIHRVIPA